MFYEKRYTLLKGVSSEFHSKFPQEELFLKIRLENVCQRISGGRDKELLTKPGLAPEQL
jgi:hypothetical protein